MQKDLSRRVCIAGASLLLGLGVASSAAAQDADTLKPPPPTKEDNPPYIFPMLLMVVILAGCVGANLIPSKRGHQD